VTVPASPSPARPSPLVARGLVKSYGPRTVLDGVDLTASPGQVVALVGENGAGKSTLLRLLAGTEQPDSGEVRRPADVGHLAQALGARPDATVGSVLDTALLPLHRVVARLEHLAHHLTDASAAEEYAALLDWAVSHDAWDAGRRAEECASRLGLGTLEDDRPVAGLSGGQRARLALAALLTRRPGCLLLDEPTNHLDDEALALVESEIRSQPGVVVLASHDRVLLDRTADVVVDLDPAPLGSDGRGGRRYGTTAGGYSAVLRDREAARARWAAAHAAHEEERDRLRRTAATTARAVAPGRPPRDNDRFVHAYRGARNERAVSRRVRDAERRLDLLERSPVPRPPERLVFRGLGDPARRGGTVRVRGLRVDGRLELDRLDVRPGTRWLVCGGNGTGKSTLLRVLAGLPVGPWSGEVEVRARRIGHLPQDVRHPDPSRSALEVYAAAVDATRDAGTPDPPPLHALGLLTRRQATRPVGQLSLGQQRRLALAGVVALRPDLLLLDEPTNHLSLALVEELEEALQAAAATVVIATHDRWLRARWSGPSLALPGRTAQNGSSRGREEPSGAG
jgi:macrolide transport system ATP-binding/permease protein